MRSINCYLSERFLCQDCQKGRILVWQRFCEPARLRITYSQWVSVTTLPYFSVLYDSHIDLFQAFKIMYMYQFSLILAHDVFFCLFVFAIDLSLCQTSCPLRTVHFISHEEIGTKSFSNGWEAGDVSYTLTTEFLAQSFISPPEMLNILSQGIYPDTGFSLYTECTKK